MKSILVFITLLAFIAVVAAQAPKSAGVDFNRALVSEVGAQLTGPDGKAPLTLLDVASTALLANLPSDQGLSGQQKYDLYDLARRIKTGPQPVALSETDLATLRKRIGEVFGPGVVGPAWKALDPALK
jgi:hypothetical protein